MYKLIYKGIEFDDFQLYRETNNSGGCEYGYPSDEEINIESYEEADVYICPHCVKKYGLYKECDTTEAVVNEEIKDDIESNYWDITCSVKGCFNKNSYDGYLNAKECQLVKESESEE
jgi:hypothetical protein